MWLVFNSDLLAPRVSGQRSQPWEQPPVLFLRTNSSRQFNFDLNPKTDHFRDRSIFELIFTLKIKFDLAFAFRLHFDFISSEYFDLIFTCIFPLCFPSIWTSFYTQFLSLFSHLFWINFDLTYTFTLRLHFKFILTYHIAEYSHGY